MADTLKSKRVAIGTGSTELLACVADGTTVIQMLQVGNIDGTNDATFDLTLNKNAAGDDAIMSSITVAAGKSVVVYSDSNGKLYLNDDGTEDTLDATASAASDLVAVLSYIERT